MHLHDIVLPSPIANSDQRASSPQKFFIHIYNMLVLGSGRVVMICAFYFTIQRKRREAHSPRTQSQSLAEITIIPLHA